MRTLTRVLLAALMPACIVLPARAQTPGTAPVTVRSAVDRIIQQEAQTAKIMRGYSPRIETYIQEERPDPQFGSVPVKDHYFLGQVDFRYQLNEHSFIANPSAWSQFRAGLSRDFAGGVTFSQPGFVAMMLPDPDRFDRKHYQFEYVRQEFLGSVRCLVFDVAPLPKTGKGTFMGRIWAEDQGYNIVRINGTYLNAMAMSRYFHFDSWRVNVQPGLWLPAYIFSSDDVPSGVPLVGHTLHFKAESRLWGYDLKIAHHEEESTELIVEDNSAQNQANDVDDYSPVESQRLFQRDAENNYLDRLQKAGLLAPPGPVDKILETVVNNLEVTNNLNIDPPVHCRVLLTSPLEVFAVGHTIVISRGLIDVLPDEASLAMVLSHGLARIALGYQLDTRFGFDDRLIFPDTQSLQRLKLTLNEHDEDAIDAKTLLLLQNSPYKDKLGNAGLFLKELDARAKDLPSLLDARLGNPLGWGGHVHRLTELMSRAPELQQQNVAQIAALPLGARIKINSWNDAISMMKTQPVALLSAREKLPFEVTPLRPYLVRVEAPQASESQGTQSPAVAAAPQPAAAASVNPQR